MNTLPTQSCTRPPGTSNTALPRKGSTATSPAFTRRARSTLSSAQRKILESARLCSVSRMYRSNASTVLGLSSAAQAGSTSTAAKAIHFMSPFSPAAAKIGYMDLSYPIGKFDFKQTVMPPRYPALIAEIAAAPALFRDAVRGLDDAHLDTRHRPGGCPARQRVDPVAVSHMNSHIRLCLALPETEPTIRP